MKALRKLAAEHPTEDHFAITRLDPKAFFPIAENASPEAMATSVFGARALTAALVHPGHSSHIPTTEGANLYRRYTRPGGKEAHRMTGAVSMPGKRIDTKELEIDVHGRISGFKFTWMLPGRHKETTFTLNEGRLHDDIETGPGVPGFHFGIAHDKSILSGRKEDLSDYAHELKHTPQTRSKAKGMNFRRLIEETQIVEAMAAHLEILFKKMAAKQGFSPDRVALEVRTEPLSPDIPWPRPVFYLSLSPNLLSD